MAWKKLEARLVGEAPFLMHAGTTVDPTHPLTKSLKAITSKRKKVDADYEEMGRIEFYAGLYTNKDGVPVLPGTHIEATIIGAAKTEKSGRLAKSAIYTTEDFPLEYEGPKDVKSLWEDNSFRLSAQVRVGTSRVLRIRPMFTDWKAAVSINYEDSILNKGQVLNWLKMAGTSVGIGDWRPRYGRFSVEQN